MKAEQASTSPPKPTEKVVEVPKPAQANENRKGFERKNSFLGKLFSGSSSKKSKNGSSQPKPIIKTFSAQFPPPELVDHGNPIYTALIKKPKTRTSSPASNNSNLVSSQSVPSAQVHNANYVCYDRPYSQPTSIERIHSPYFQPNLSMYGYSSPVQNRFPSGSDSSNSMYSNPPPPLPYRPPPPNPYLRIQPSPRSEIDRKGSPMNKRNSGGRNVRFADESGSSDVTIGNSSGPSSMESATTKPLFDDTLVVIERSNSELEKKLSNAGDLVHSERAVVHRILAQGPPHNAARTVDTIHNNRNLLSHEEIIYEVGSSEPSTEKPTQKEIAPSYPSISDLSIVNEVGTNFKSLTAQKLMAGLSFNSIDTLLEVNAAAEARTKLNESTETIDFGVI